LTSAATHLWRLAKAGRALGTGGALLLLEGSDNAPPPVKLACRLARFGARVPAEPRYADALAKLGPAYVKLGQALATRPDIVGDATARDLARLQDKLPPAPFGLIKAAIEEQLGGPVAQFFSSFDETPVHKAVTTDGRTVAVKVLRPHIERDFEAAIETFAWGANQAEARSPEARRLRLRTVVDTFKQWTGRELDLRLEAASAAELAAQMAGDARYRVPAVDWDRTRRRVMTLEWIDGIPLTDQARLKASGHDLSAIATTAVEIFLRQAIVHGFFHADQHQGNFFVDSEGRLAVVDFGIMGRILHGLFTGNYGRIADIHFDEGYVPAHHSRAEFATALRAVGEPIRDRPLADVSAAALLDQLFAITRLFDMQLQPHLLLLQKTLVMVEGLAMGLDPKINMWDVGRPFLTSWAREELGPEAKAADGLRVLFRTARRLLDRLDPYATPKGAELGAAAVPAAPPPASASSAPLWAGAAGLLAAGVAIGWLIG
jgi:ubiquinone biosynthesis protein